MEVISTRVELERRVVEGSKRYHEIIMSSEIEPFFHNNAELFRGKRILDLGCGEAFPRRILRRAEFKARYTGIDSGAGCGPHASCSKPDIQADYAGNLPYGLASFDIVLALFPALNFTNDRDMKHILAYLADGGKFVHSGTPYCYKRHHIMEDISRHLSLVKAEQYITPVICGGEEIYLHNNIFSIWTNSVKD